MNAHRGARILIVDDAKEMAQALGEYLEGHGYATELAFGVGHASARFAESAFDVVITDLRMQDGDGFELLEAIRAIDTTVPVFVMTAFGSIENALEAVKRGAYHYFAKPLKTDEVRVFVERALSQRRMQQTQRRLLRDAHADYGFDTLVATSNAMRDVFEMVAKVAQSNASVLITGESGTGKELIARAIHFRSPRKQSPFVLMNCTAIPGSLLESELFGHEKGAFTGAVKARAGLAVEASGGTLFLDEIGDLQPELQPKLLRLLQEGEVRPVGGNHTRKVDVRVVAATHVDLEGRIQDDRFRADLYYRLNVVPIHLPPLRERKEDIPLLAQNLLNRTLHKNPHLRAKTIGDDAMTVLKAYDWPGNVRELGNIVERAATLCAEETIDAGHVAYLRSQSRGDGANDHNDQAAATMIQTTLETLADGLPSLREFEDRYIAHVLEAVADNKTKAAAILGVDPSTLYRRRKKP